MNLHLLIVLALCGLLVQTGYAKDDAPGDIELNPSEYVPLAVGNSWTYEHYHWNNMYLQQGSWWKPDLAERLKPFVDVEIPGYPHGEGNALPPDSLLVPVDRILTIEITHTERIDGWEYFVFSDADYDWPPLPAWFLAGKKVRWSDEGVLVFRWNGQEVSIYDFGELQNGYTVTLPGESGTSVDVDRLVIFYEAPKTSNQHSLVHFRLDDGETLVNRYCDFLPGYGMGLFVINFFGLSDFLPLYENALTGLSANIDGEEIWYDQLDPNAIPPDPEPPAAVWGQLAKLNRRSGFDFSAGTETDYYSEDADVVSDVFPPGIHGSATILLCSHTCVGLPPAKIVDLGRVDFGRLVSEGRPSDLQLVQSQSQIHDPQAGHTYAIRTREGGIALMHVLKVVEPRGRRSYALSDYIFFDWVYYPPAALSPDETAIQPTSWGALKRSILRTK